MKCRNCGFEIQFSEAVFCPNCGTKTTAVSGEIAVNTANEKNDEIQHDISSVWPEWHLEKRLGKGSYGVVYQAVRNDSGIESRAAIKIISIPSDRSEIAALRSDGYDEFGTKEYFRTMVNDFIEEIRLMDSFKGVQNIVSVEDYKVIEKTDEIGWDIYIRMELLTSFNAYVSDKKLSEIDIIRLGIDIATALEICSKRNVIHRDIKPENIFINDFGYFKLGDFGIARKLDNKTSGMSHKGTPNYMAPEVARSSNYDERVDIYSLGIVLYKLLNDNKIPFLPADKQIFSYNERQTAVDRRLRGDRITPPCKASAAMAHLVLKACAYECEDRFNSAAEMKEALKDVLQGKYKGHLAEANEYDKTVSVRDSGKSQPIKEPVNNHAGFAEVPARDSAGQNNSGKSYISIIAIAVALGLLTGILVGGIILLTKFSSGELSLHIDTVTKFFITDLTDFINKLLL